MQELLGAPVARAITENLIDRVDLLTKNGIVPKLAIVRLGNEAGDIAYERGACSRMAKVGIEVETHSLSESISQEELVDLVSTLSADSTVHGILLMRPLPTGIDEQYVASHVAPEKDIDGMTSASLARIYAGYGAGFAPCTAQAVMALLAFYNIDVEGKHVCVLGRSLVIGKPVAQLLLAKNATVTLCHSKTTNLTEVVAQADIVVSCMGRAHAVVADMISPGAIVIDVGTNDDGKGGITGDVDFESVSLVAGALTPVPRGVGSVTTSILAANVVESAEMGAIL